MWQHDVGAYVQHLACHGQSLGLPELEAAVAELVECSPPPLHVLDVQVGQGRGDLDIDAALLKSGRVGQQEERLEVACKVHVGRWR
jgi:hypothetical protein